MSQHNNVIDLTKRLESKAKGSNHAGHHGNAPVLDMTERRKEIISEERRQVKRTILTEFVGACAIVPGRGLIKIALHDISDSGIAMDVDFEVGQFKVGEEVAIRVYLNRKTYFPFTVKISNVRQINSDGVIRHGASFLKETLNKEALHHFVKFIESVSASLESDAGDIMVSNINK